MARRFVHSLSLLPQQLWLWFWEFKGLFKFQFSIYALYYPFGFCFPLALGEASYFSLQGIYKQDDSYFKYSSIRYLKMTLQGREIYGHTAYLTLTQSLEFPSTYLPLQYDRDDRIRRESTMLKLKQQASINPYKASLKEQIIFISVASFYASFGWYQVLLGQENLTNGEKMLCSVLSFGCLWGNVLIIDSLMSKEI